MGDYMEIDTIPLKVLYEDNHLIAVVKPAGLLIQADKTGDPTLLDLVRYYLKMKYNKPGKVYLGLMHRLDRPVSGVLLLAKTSKSAARLTAAFKEGAVHKIYLAVCSPPPEPAEGILEDYLIKDQKANITKVVAISAPRARYAKLSYKTIKRTTHNALVQIDLHTGRSHQIRVQFAHHGWPIVGDKRYGNGEDRPLALFAHRLEFIHPIHKGTVIVEAKPEKGLLAL